MSEEKPWWVTSDPNHPAHKEAAVSLDDTNSPAPADETMWQKLHDRVTALEDWVKSAKYPWTPNSNPAGISNAEAPAAAAEAPAQDSAAEGVA
jgi:cell envelope opacity-associated protein A